MRTQIQYDDFVWALFIVYSGQPCQSGLMHLSNNVIEISSILFKVILMSSVAQRFALRALEDPGFNS